MIRPFGERGLLVELDDAEGAQRLDTVLRRDPPRGVLGTVPGLASLLVELDPAAHPAAAEAAINAAIASGAEADVPAPRTRVIPVVYGGEHGPDLADVAALAGLTEDEVIALHASTVVRVRFLGFAPGFAYIGDLPEALRVPRLATPRTRTPAGSVAIADAMTGIYPAALPGGWRVIGRTPVDLFDARRDPPAYLAPGDEVRFVAIGVDAWDGHRGPPADW
ncbi:MAG TPA: 5-oxoprolinase subunit PxpB [Candidatus Limnocylindria bacterium]|nr:5-oxoprolinase subunit PxpB [Candidatus Limnocylindria bacterium]